DPQSRCSRDSDSPLLGSKIKSRTSARACLVGRSNPFCIGSRASGSHGTRPELCKCPTNRADSRCTRIEHWTQHYQSGSISRYEMCRSRDEGCHANPLAHMQQSAKSRKIHYLVEIQAVD